ncbi:MAG: hypothetical protein RLZZ177_918 [Pseudomonadota bacterium]
MQQDVREREPPQQVRERVQVRAQQHAGQVLEQVLEQGQVRGPKRRHNLGLPWRGSKMDFSSIHQRRFSKPHLQRCANC